MEAVTFGKPSSDAHIVAADSARATQPIAQSQRGDIESCESEMYSSVQYSTRLEEDFPV